MKHVDLPRIIASVTARFRFLQDFTGFGDEDRKAMTESLLVLGARLSRILDELYDHLLSYDDTRQTFLGPAGELDPAYMAQRKEHLTEWVLMAAASPSLDEFASYTVKVASQHLGLQEGARHRAVPPRYIVATTSRLQTALTQALFEELPRDPALAVRASVAWNKFLIIHLELFLSVIAPSWPEWDEASSPAADELRDMARAAR
jgi:hypothetical protein